MIKFLLPTLFAFVSLQSFSQPPQTNNSNSNGAVINANQPIVLDSTHVFLKQENVSGTDGIEQGDSKKNAILQEEINSYKLKKSSVKRNSQSRSASQEDQLELREKVTNIKGLAQTSIDLIEANILYYDEGNYDASRAPYLIEAMRLNPNHVEGIKLWLANSMVIGDTITASKVLAQMDTLGLIPEAMRCYAADLIASVPNNTTLITHGELDTYCAFNEQLLKHRNTIEVISLDLIQSPQYRELLLKRGYSIPVQPNVNIAYLGDLIRTNPNRVFAFSMTIPSEYLIQFEEDMVPNGLVFLYPNTLNENQILSNNESFLDSFTYMDCGQEPEQSIAVLKENYLPMILTVETLNTDKSRAKRSKIESKKLKLRKKN